MFSARNTDNPIHFRPALQYLINTTNPHLPQSLSSRRRSHSASSLDSDEETGDKMSSRNATTSSELHPSIPLINISRSPSPYRSQEASSPTSESDEEYENWGTSSRRPFLSQEEPKYTGWRWLLYSGGLGQFLFNTTIGWRFYIGILVFWLGGCGIGLTVMNRIILWSGYLQANYTSHTELMTLIAGVYKFPWPMTTTFIELLITHGFIWLSAFLTRLASPVCITAGVSSAVAPYTHLQNSNSPGFRGDGKKQGMLSTFGKLSSASSGGIAGGGVFEFDRAVARQVLPLAIIFVVKVILSNISFAYAQLPIYVMARIGIVPFSLLFTALLGQQQHSASTISSALIASLFLLLGTIKAGIRAPWESIVAGVFSSIFVALYPVQIQRTYRALVAQLVPQGDLIGAFASGNGPSDFSGSREETRAYWRLLHYTSLLSILIFIPLLLISGELGSVYRNCYFMDVFFHWLMILCGGTGSWAVFWCTVALTRATSPLTTSFLFVPRAAFLLPIMAGFKMPAYSWIGFGMCWASCAWFLMGRIREGRPIERLR
ncbi:hypothetical protein DSL72_007353 [Monilinia vaccinii-corymbosi]|uniref:Gdp-fucose transporter protein n=1 Tax=Monilinia vaccinii-corymbosi TaxID=61207 RepID=A0A8A3PLE6_9HELO|nr:hypothetical protein DSL72_007353 [Monilinia vaccinii-corymbosi]